MTTMLAEGLSAELFDKPLPRHPLVADLALMLGNDSPVCVRCWLLRMGDGVMLASSAGEEQGLAPRPI